MALEIVPSKKLPPVTHSLILAFAGIPQPRPLSPNGRVFRKLAGKVRPFYLDHDELVEITYEEAFVLRFTRWLPEAMRDDFQSLFEQGISVQEAQARTRAFMPKLKAHRKACPPPWEADFAQAAQERAA